MYLKYIYVMLSILQIHLHIYVLKGNDFRRLYKNHWVDFLSL